MTHFTGTGYAEIQQARWNSLIQARIRVEEARQKFSDASTLHSNVAPALTDVPGWKDATIESYRLQFRIIDLNGDGLIDFTEMYISVLEITVSLSKPDLLSCEGVQHWIR